MDKKGIESFTLAQLSKLIKRNNPTGLDDDFIIIGENLPNTELFKYPCRVDALVAVICLEGELICNINLKEYRITTTLRQQMLRFQSGLSYVLQSFGSPCYKQHFPGHQSQACLRLVWQ